MSVGRQTFVFGDGDRIRQRVESLLFAGELAALRSFSAAITLAIGQLAHGANTTMAADVIVAGGDDLLFCVSAECYDRTIVARMATSFMEQTGCSMSFGVASDLESAYLNLRRAKAQGGGSIVGM